MSLGLGLSSAISLYVINSFVFNKSFFFLIFFSLHIVCASNFNGIKLIIDLTIQWTLPREAFFHSSTKQPLPSVSLQIKIPCNPLSRKHYHLAYHSFIIHIDPTLWTKRCVGKDMCKRKKRRIKWAKSKKSQFNASHHKCKSIQCKSKVQSPIQTKKQKSKKHTALCVIIKPFSTLKPQPHITTTKALSHEALSKSFTRTTTV